MMKVFQKNEAQKKKLNPHIFLVMGPTAVDISLTPKSSFDSKSSTKFLELFQTFSSRIEKIAVQSKQFQLLNCFLTQRVLCNRVWSSFHPSVRPFFYLLLNFGMMLGTHMKLFVTDTDCLEKICPKIGKTTQKNIIF